jgi:hypothetical protein
MTVTMHVDGLTSLGALAAGRVAGLISDLIVDCSSRLRFWIMGTGEQY